MIMHWGKHFCQKLTFLTMFKIRSFPLQAMFLTTKLYIFLCSSFVIIFRGYCTAHKHLTWDLILRILCALFDWESCFHAGYRYQRQHDLVWYPWQMHPTQHSQDGEDQLYSVMLRWGSVILSNAAVRISYTQ